MDEQQNDRSLWFILTAIGLFSIWYVATGRSQNPLWLIMSALCAFALVYHLYGRFVALRMARVSDALDNDRAAEGSGSLWALGYHFAAIAGAGALIAPVAVIQYGFLPALLWILMGASLAGAVHDFVALLVSRRRASRPLPQIARDELRPIAAPALALLSLLTLIVVLSAVATALLDLMARDAGVTYALILTVPFAFFVVLYARFVRPGHREEAAALGLILFTLAVIVGSRAGSTGFMRLFLMSRRSLVILLAVYCLAAALFPMGVLSLVRGALSGYLILGATGLMAVFVAFVAPSLQIGPTSSIANSGGPLPVGRAFPTVGVVLAVGVISGFHALIASGPTAQLVRHEREVLPLGFGSMLLVGFLCLLVVAVTATLSPADYLAINTPLPPERITEAVGASPTVIHQLREPLGQSVAARPGSPATLAVGIVQAYRTLSKADPSRFRSLYRLVNVLAALLLFTALEAGVRATWFLARGWSLAPAGGISLRQVVGRPPSLRLRAGDWFSVTLDWSRILGGSTASETPGQEAASRRSALSGWGVTLAVTVVWAALSVSLMPRFTDPIVGVSSLLLAGGVLCLGSVLVMRLHTGRGRWLVLVTALPALVVLLTGLVGGIYGMRDLWSQSRPAEAFSTAFGELPILATQQEWIPIDRVWAIVREMPVRQASEAFAAGGREELAQVLSARFGESVPQEGLRLADLVIGRARALTLWGRLQVAGIVLTVILTLIVVSESIAPFRAAAAEERPHLPEPGIAEQRIDEPWLEMPGFRLPTVPGGQLLRELIRPGEEATPEMPPSPPVEKLVRQDVQEVERERPSGVSLTGRILLFGASIGLSLRGSWVLYHNRGAFFTTVLFYTVALVCLRLAFYEGLWQPWSVRQGLAALGHKVRAQRWELLCLGLIFGVAVFFRVYRFGYFPPVDGVGFEEAQAGGDAFKVLRYGHRTVEFPLTVYLPALSFALLGESTTTLRLPFLILGCLTIVPFYLLLRELVDCRAALFGAFLLAVSRWHAVVSRIADELFVPIFFEVLILYLVVKTGESRKIRYYFWLAILSAYMLYAYTAYRVIPFLILLVLMDRFFKSVVSQVRQRRGIVEGLRTILGTGWQPALVFVVTFLTVASPLLVVTRQGDRFFVEAFVRASASGGGGTASSILTAQALDRFKNAMLIFTHKGASYPALNIPGEPMLDVVSRVLFVLGVVYSLITFFHPYRLWLLLWIVAVLAVGSLFPPNLYVGRFSNLIPVVFIIISFMVGDFSRWVDRQWGVRPQRLFSAFLVLLAGAVLVLDYRTLFDRQVSYPDVRRAYQNRVVALCNYAGSLPDDTYVYVWDRDQLLEYAFLPSDFVWACHDMRGEAVSDMRSVLPARVQAGQIGYIFINPTEPLDELSQLIGRYYPQTLAPSTVIEGEQGSYRIVVYLVNTSSVRAP